MIGEYVIYYQVKVIGDICDNRFLLKPTSTVMTLWPEVPLEPSYLSAKAMDLIDPEEREKLVHTIRTMFDELPYPKSHRK